jgi:predicted alpha/beta-hydrolase family hydrolase
MTSGTPEHPTDPTRPTVVLAHGAFADSSSVPSPNLIREAARTTCGGG